MLRKSLALLAPLLAVAALAPATASAADIDLRGAPTMRQIEGGRIQLRFAVDHRLPTRNGKVTTKVTVNGKVVERLARAGRHGRAFVYTALVHTVGLEVGEKYVARFYLPGGRETRLVKLHPRRA